MKLAMQPFLAEVEEWDVAVQAPFRCGMLKSHGHTFAKFKTAVKNWQILLLF